MKVIELQPGDRVRLLIANNFAGGRTAPSSSSSRAVCKRSSSATTSGRRLNSHCEERHALPKCQLQLIERLKAIGELFDDTTWDERKLPASERHGTTMVLAIRHWFFEGFRDLERRH